MVVQSDVTVYPNFALLDSDKKVELLYTMIVQDSTTYSNCITLNNIIVITVKHEDTCLT